MEAPDLERDGWCLDDVEALHLNNETSFSIPPEALRRSLEPGASAKLVFRIRVEDGEDAVERMWVAVRERLEGGYLGVLDNKPTLIAENDGLWLGSQLIFEPRHVIDVLLLQKRLNT